MGRLTANTLNYDKMNYSHLRIRIICREVKNVRERGTVSRKCTITAYYLKKNDMLCLYIIF